MLSGQVARERHELLSVASGASRDGAGGGEAAEMNLLPSSRTIGQTPSLTPVGNASCPPTLPQPHAFNSPPTSLINSLATRSYQSLLVSGDHLSGSASLEQCWPFRLDEASSRDVRRPHFVATLQTGHSPANFAHCGGIFARQPEDGSCVHRVLHPGTLMSLDELQSQYRTPKPTRGEDPAVGQDRV